MTFETLQSDLAARIAADALLAPLGAAIEVDPFAEQETAKSAIAARLRATGVCIEIGFPSVMSPETALGGSTLVEAMCEIFVAEHIQRAHTPNKAALVTQLIRAITKPAAAGFPKPPRLRTSESVKTEHGYVLHMLSFFVPLNIKQ